MAAVLLFRVSSAVLAAAVGLCPLVPPEHVHDTEEHGHHRLVVHRHADAHPLSAPAGPHRREVHEHDDPVLTLTAVFTIPGSQAVSPPSAVSVVVLPEPPVAAAFHRAGDSREPLIHGPPRAPASPRAPPLSSRL
jgi:hypothetical protein